MSRPNPRIRVLIVDDHPLIREGLRRSLTRCLDIEVVAEAATAAEALAHAAQADVIITDIHLGEVNGIDLIAQLIRPTLDGPVVDHRVLVLTMLPAEAAAVTCIQSGAHGFLTKGAAPSEVVEAVRTVARGMRHITPEVASLLADHAARPTRLSPREMEVLHLLASGYRVGQVAQALRLSVKTVSTHKSNIQTKLGVDSLAGLVRYAMEHGLVPTAATG